MGVRVRFRDIAGDGIRRTFVRATLAPSPSCLHSFADFRRLRCRRSPILTVVALLAASLTASCIEPDLPLEHASDRRRLTISLSNGEDLTLPVTFAGDLPCKDCIARRVTLTLRPDTVFLTRTIWLGDPEPNEAYDLGRWDLDASGRRLILKGGANGVRLAMIDPDAIHMIGTDANDSTSAGGSATLARARSVERFDEPLRLRGYFLHTRGGPVLGECSSRKRWPIAAEADYFVLERAYRAARLAPGAPLLVSVDGRLVLRRRSSGEREMVVIERVNRLWRKGDCRNDPSRKIGRAHV